MAKTLYDLADNARVLILRYAMLTKHNNRNIYGNNIIIKYHYINKMIQRYYPSMDLNLPRTARSRSEAEGKYLITIRDKEIHGGSNNNAFHRQSVSVVI